MDSLSNYKFVDFVAGQFDEDVYIDRRNGQLYVKYKNNLFNI
jgi:phage repressor protein C with HTH and peptisase S24 domain